MLPKPDKNKKNSITEATSESKEISAADKTKQKRRLLIIIISLTIGLSSIFSVYNFFKNYKFTLPQVSLNQSPLDTQLKSLLKSDYPNWTFTVLTNTTPDFPTIVSTLEKYHQKTDTDLISLLPQGLKLVQYKTDNRYQLVVVTPEKQFYFDISHPVNPSVPLKEVIATMYWSSVKQ